MLLRTHLFHHNEVFLCTDGDMPGGQHSISGLLCVSRGICVYWLTPPRVVIALKGQERQARHTMFSLVGN